MSRPESLSLSRSSPEPARGDSMRNCAKFLRGFFVSCLSEELLSRRIAKAQSRTSSAVRNCSTKAAVADFLLDDPLLLGFQFDGHQQNNIANPHLEQPQHYQQKWPSGHRKPQQSSLMMAVPWKSLSTTALRQNACGFSVPSHLFPSHRLCRN